MKPRNRIDPGEALIFGALLFAISFAISGAISVALWESVR